VSGHSKWATIRRKKGAVDAKRGKIFTKLIREIATAARLSGGEPDANPRLRLAVDRARLANMPKDTIERAIKRGTGDTEGAQFEEATYEGFGPGGTAVLVETLTDNRNRTVGEVRHVFSRWGGNLGANGCAAHMFRKRGLIQFDRASLDVDALLEAALDAGADDVQEGSDSVDVVTEPADFDAVRRALEAAGFRPTHAALGREPTSTVKLEGKDAESMLALSDALEDLDDVQSVSANFDISEAEMARLAG
jgi:YebC/PmpR family DNA-binding regulatory protein